MLVLLIIFMITAPMLHQGIEVALPSARGAEPALEGERSDGASRSPPTALVYVKEQRSTRPSCSRS
jgi:biopolymer transport protein ExbD